MAMKIGSKYDSYFVQERHWQQFCEIIGYRYLAMKELIHKLSQKIKIAAELEKNERIEKNLHNPIIDKIITTTIKNIDNTLLKFSVQ